MEGNEHIGKLMDFYKYMPLEGLQERLTELDEDVEHMQSSLEISILVRMAIAAEISRRNGIKTENLRGLYD